MDFQAIREDIGGKKKVVNLNSAGASLPPKQVFLAMTEHLKLEAEVGGYKAAEVAGKQIQGFYRKAAKLINAKHEDEIAFTESATHGWQKLFYSMSLSHQDSVVLFDNEYVSFYMAVLQQQRRLGFQIRIVGSDSRGDIDLAKFRSAVDSSTKVVLLGHMPTQSGILNPAENIGEILRGQPQVRYILDATQTIGQYPVDVEAIGCDALCTTGRKFLRGPRGTGFLYVKKEFAEQLDPVMIDLGSAVWTATHEYEVFPAARRFECWEKNYAAMLGLSAAVEYANKIGIQEIWRRASSLAAMLREGLRGIRGVSLCDPGRQQGAIVTFRVEGVDCGEVVNGLERNGYAISQSKLKYARLDFEKRGLRAVCRASPHYFNTEQEISGFIGQVEQIACKLS